MKGGDNYRLVAAAALLLGVVACDPYVDLLEADRLTVGHSGSADFPSIQSAVGSARAGATIVVEAGTYIENVEIEQNVTLLGTGAGTIVRPPANSDPQEPVIEVLSAVGVRIEGFAVTGPSDGIQIRDSSEVVIASIVASGNGDDGIDVQHSSDVQISGIFENNAGQGIQVDEGADGVVVHSSTLSSNGQDGVKLESSSNCTVSDNVITNNGDDGVLVGESTGAKLLQNTITGNLGNGIHLRASPDTLLVGNTLTDNAGGNIEID